MLVATLRAVACGAPARLEDTLRDDVFLRQQPVAPTCPPHATAVHSIVTTPETTLVASAQTLTVVAKQSGDHAELVRQSRFLRRHPRETLFLLGTRVPEVCGADLRTLATLSQHGVRDAEFHDTAAVAAVRTRDWSIFDVRSGTAVGGGTDGGESVVSAGNAVVVGGETTRAYDVRTFRRVWESDAAGRVVRRGTGVLVLGARAVMLGDDGRVVWQRAEAWGCAERDPDAEFWAVGRGRDVVAVASVDGREVGVFPAAHHGTATAVCWDTDVLELVTGDSEGVVFTWNGWSRSEVVDEWD